MAAPSLLTSIPAAQKLAKKKKKAFRVGKFDKDAVRLVQSGTTSLSGISRALGVDVGQALQRLELLAGKGYLVKDAGAADAFRLGVEGYNKYARPLRAQEKGRLPEQGETSETKLPPEHAGEKEGEPQIRLLGLQASPQKQDQPAAPFVPLPPSVSAEGIPIARSSVDLGDLLRKGAPGGRAAQGERVNAGEQAVISNGNGAQREICELCRAGFSVSVKEPGLSKYAHCSCGAAYHKDCHDSLTGNGGRCARCGRKLAAMLDRRSEEALSSVKDAFD